MSNATQSKRSLRRNRSIHQVHYNIRRRDDEMPKPFALPTSHPLEIQAYDRQVAGHRSCEDTKYLGLLQCNDGTILKPILKESQKREVEFYRRIFTSKNPDLMELRSCIAKYYGCKKFSYNGHEQDYIILEDLSVRMLQPCIMDVKIGRQTWDPMATDEKIKREQSKYALCKQQYGFCIPGFQVYRLSTGKLQKYNKDYGKKLHGQAVIDAIRTYLNCAGGRAACRALLLQLLSALWRVQRWARRGAPVRLRAASLLLLYDAARHDCAAPRDPPSTTKQRSTTLPRRRSVPSLHSGSTFSGQLSAHGPIYNRVKSVPMTPMALTHSAFAPPPPITSSWTDALDRLTSNHSFDHNYENKLSKIKMDYRAVLDQLSYDSPPNPWATVKIIDFAHAFFTEEEENTVDENFKEGIDNFVEIFEALLTESDDHVC